jgi:hypothetical protein
MAATQLTAVVVVAAYITLQVGMALAGLVAAVQEVLILSPLLTQAQTLAVVVVALGEMVSP